MPAGYPPRQGEVVVTRRTTTLLQTEMPAGYQDQYHHPPYPPGSYPPQQPYHGHQGNPHAGGAAYASQPPSYPHQYTNQYGHPQPHDHYPHYAYPPPGPQYGAPPHYGMPQQNKAANPVMDGDGAAPPADAQGADQEDKTPAGEEGAKDDSKTQHPNQYNHPPPYGHYPYYPYPPPPGSHYGAIPPHYGMQAAPSSNPAAVEKGEDAAEDEEVKDSFKPLNFLPESEENHTTAENNTTESSGSHTPHE